MTRSPTLLAAAAALVAVATAAAPGWTPYAVHSGDTLWGLARSHHTTVSSIQRANDLDGDTIYIGQLLALPGSGVPAHAQPAATAPDYRLYLIRSGDTLTGVARRAGTDLSTLARLNHLSGAMTIYLGQRLRLPGPPAPVHAAPPSTPSFRAAIAASARILSARAEPGHTAIQTMVAAEARRQGVDPALAQAIAYQESGFTQRMVSATDAVGAMQLEPYTASWLAGYSHRRLDRYDTADNIRGGIMLLHLLREQASVPDTIAGYYQGLASVRTRGYYPDTTAYVNNVLALTARFQ